MGALGRFLKQIPFGNDRKKNKGNGNSRFPTGMTERKAKTKADSRFPLGWTERKTRASRVWVSLSGMPECAIKIGNL